MIKLINIKDFVTNHSDLKSGLEAITTLSDRLKSVGEWDNVNEMYKYTIDDFDFFTIRVNMIQNIIGEDEPGFLDLLPCDAINLYCETVGDSLHSLRVVSDTRDIRKLHEMITNIQKVYTEYTSPAVVTHMEMEDIITLYYSAVHHHLKMRVNGIFGKNVSKTTPIDIHMRYILDQHIEVINSPARMQQYNKMMEDLMCLVTTTSITQITTKAGRNSMRVSKDFLACFIRVLSNIAMEVNYMVSNYHESYIVVLPLAAYRPHRQLFSVSDAYDAFVNQGPLQNPNLFYDDLYKRLFDALFYLYVSACKLGYSEVKITDTSLEYITNAYSNENPKYKGDYTGSVWTDDTPEPAEEENDMVNSPKHYTFAGYECLDIMEAIYGKEALMNFCKLNAFKYLWRSEHKNGLEDIEKAHFYLNRYITVAKK